MRGYVEAMERLACHMPEGREPTGAEVCAAMADDRARWDDAAKEMRRDRELIPGRDDLAALDDLVNANIRQMAGPWPISDRDGD